MNEIITGDCLQRRVRELEEENEALRQDLKHHANVEREVMFLRGIQKTMAAKLKAEAQAVRRCREIRG